MAAAAAAAILGAGAIAAVATGRVDPKQIQLPEKWPAFSLGGEEGADPEAP